MRKILMIVFLSLITGMIFAQPLDDEPGSGGGVINDDPIAGWQMSLGNVWEESSSGSCIVEQNTIKDKDLSGPETKEVHWVFFQITGLRLERSIIQSRALMQTGAFRDDDKKGREINAFRPF